MAEIENLILDKLSSIEGEIKEIKHFMKIVDKRLSLIENRLSNIEPWVAVDNKHLEYKGEAA